MSVRSFRGKDPRTDEIRSFLKRIRCWMLDMDGTVTLGEELIPGANRFFEAINRDRKSDRIIFVTNNSSHGATHYLRRIERIGLCAERERLVISTDAMIAHIRSLFPGLFTVFPLGTPEFEEELANARIRFVQSSQLPDAVLVAFDTTLTYDKLTTACNLIRKGIPYFATNPDKVCPLDGDDVLPDCGALISYLETCTGVGPKRIFGKPDPAMIDLIRDRYGYTPDEMIMVGDRLYTDIAFAKNAGIACVAVLTGETTRSEISAGLYQPDIVADHIADLSDYLV